MKYKKHRREEAKYSKEKVARIFSSQDNQIKIDPVKGRPTHHNMLNFPNGANYGDNAVHGSKVGHAQEPIQFGVQGQGQYNGGSLDQSWPTPSTQYYMKNHGSYVDEASGSRDKQKFGKSHRHVPYTCFSRAVDTKEPGHRYMKESKEQQSMNDIYTNQSLYDSMEAKIYGFNQTGKYYFNGKHASSVIKYENSHDYDASNLNSERSDDPVVEHKDFDNQDRQLCSNDAQKGVDHHAILRQKLTVPDEDDVLAPISYVSPQKSQTFIQTPYSYIPAPLSHSSAEVDCCNQLISKLLERDKILDLSDLYKMTQQLSTDKHNQNVTSILCELGDRVVGKFVRWTKHLPFFSEISIEAHSQMLTSKWHELFLFITTAYKSVEGSMEAEMTSEELYNCYMRKLQVSIYYEKSSYN